MSNAALNRAFEVICAPPSRRARFGLTYYHPQASRSGWIANGRPEISNRIVTGLALEGVNPTRSDRTFHMWRMSLIGSMKKRDLLSVDVLIGTAKAASSPY